MTASMNSFIDKIFSIQGPEQFNALALEAYEFQRENCPVYREYLNLIEKGEFHPESVEQIPFLPIRSFKSRDVLTGPAAESGVVFTSSATTGMVPSHHIVKDISVYERSFREGFRNFYGESGSYNLLALLPSYLEREGSSLVYMAEKLIAETKANGAEGGFFLYDHLNLLDNLKKLKGRKTILLGVSFALLDFAKYAKGQIPDPQERKSIFSDVIIMETGGMKGRGEELSRKELHSRLSDAFISSPIHSEYGMCELLSQAYSFDEEGVFFTPPWMRALARGIQDPFKILSREPYALGGLNIIDLANINSCCFIETEDSGKVFSPEAGDTKRSVHPPFTVDGRIKNTERRGCNMLVE